MNKSLIGAYSVLTPDEKTLALRKAAAEQAAAEKARLKRKAEEEANARRIAEEAEKKRKEKELAAAERARIKMRFAKIEHLDKALAVLKHFHLVFLLIDVPMIFPAILFFASENEWDTYGIIWLILLSAHAVVGIIQLICYISKVNIKSEQ